MYYAKGKLIPELTMAPISIYIGAPQAAKRQSEKSMHTYNTAIFVSAHLPLVISTVKSNMIT
jgi:hypothetical protein